MRDIWIIGLLFLLLACSGEKNSANEESSYYQQAVTVLKDSILLLANQNVAEQPITVTAFESERSSGGVHDFYSEGDYWWPDPDKPEGPYMRRDGLTNPDNFNKHREALFRLSEITGNLSSAFLVTGDRAYSNAVINHLDAWFIHPETKMSPHLLYAQAIKGRHTGRGIGIIDGIHFMEVVQAAIVLNEKGALPEIKYTQYQQWFAEFLSWLTTHPYGLDEMVHPNNHGTCYNMQVGLYAKFTENDSILNYCRDNYKNTIIENQMAKDGSFPLELERTKPYGYSLFNLDAMVMHCLLLSDQTNDLWTYQTESGKTILSGLEYMKPYIKDKSSWPLEPDVMYWEDWPVAHPSYLFSAVYFERDDFFSLWKQNKHFLEVPEVKRNVPIKNPLLWVKEIN